MPFTFELIDCGLNFVSDTKGLRVRQEFETVFIDMNRSVNFDEEFQSSTSSQEPFDLLNQPATGQPEHNCEFTFLLLFCLVFKIILHYQRVQSQRKTVIILFEKRKDVAICSEYKRDNSSWKLSILFWISIIESHILWVEFILHIFFSSFISTTDTRFLSVACGDVKFQKKISIIAKLEWLVAVWVYIIQSYIWK